MQKSLIKALLPIFLLVIAIPIFSFTTDYTFSQTVGTYTPITEGTSLGNTSTDDQRFVNPADPTGNTTNTGLGFPIGFSFTFSEFTYDRIAISANGWVSFGQSSLNPAVNITSTSAYGPLTNTASITPSQLANRVSAMGRDIQAQAGASILLQTIGTAPNRICVIQWTNYKKYGASGTGDSYNFQIRLNETTNLVNFVYGSFTNNATTAEIQVGLRGNATADFFARTSSTGWHNTSTALANSETVRLSQGIFPASGLTYTFTPPSPNQPPNPANFVSPTDLATLVNPASSLAWISGGGLPTGYRISLGTNNPPSNIVNNVDLGLVTSYTPSNTLEFSTTYYWKIVPYNAFGNASNNQVWSFTTHPNPQVNTLPYTQNWDNVSAPAFPWEWRTLLASSSTGSTIVTTTSTSYSAPNSVYMNNHSDASATIMLISPPISSSFPMNTIRLRFRANSNSNAVLNIGVISNPESSASFQSLYNVTATSSWIEYQVNFSTYTGTTNRIALKMATGSTYQGVSIDDLTIEQILTHDLALTALSGNLTPSAGTASTFNATIYNNGTLSQSNYQVGLYNSSNTLLASAIGSTINPGNSLIVPISWTPSITGIVSVYAKVILAGDMNSSNDQSTLLELNIQPPGSLSITIGNGSQTALMPMDFYYKNSLYECLFFPEELSNTLGSITAIKFYNTFTTNLPNMPTKVWLGTTDLSTLSAGWIDANQLTQVFDGVINFPSGQNTITITFPEPFLYLDGRNIVMMVNRPMDTVYYSSSDKFYCQTMGTNRARNMYSDSVNYDPYNPSGGTLTSTVPKTTFMMIPGGVGHITGYVKDINNIPLSGVEIQLNSGISITQTNQSGYFEFRNLLPEQYSLSFALHGYQSQIQNVDLAEDETETLSITLNQLPMVVVSGSVSASDTMQPIQNVSITLAGYSNYTAQSGVDGSFSIPGVYGNGTYTYTIAKTDYLPLHGTLTLATTNHQMGAIVLSEIPYAPLNLQAEENASGTVVNLSWQAPDPNLVGFSQSFEGTSFPPTGWSQTITNTGAALANGVLPTWCRSGNVSSGSTQVNVPDGSFQAGLWWTYTHQDEWLKTASFTCPANAFLSFETYAFYGSTTGDNYMVKISTDGGTTWTTLWNASTLSGGWNEYSAPVVIELADYAGQQTVIGFHADDPESNNGLYYQWFIDNVSVATDYSVRNESRGLEGYRIWRFPSSEMGNMAAWSMIAQVPLSQTTYSDAEWSVTSANEYRWAVKAMYSNGIVSPNAISNPITKAGNLPAAPQNVNIQIQGNSILLTWDPVTTDTSGNPVEVSYYEVHFLENPNIVPDPFTMLDYTTETSFLLEEVVDSMAYMFFAVKAVVADSRNNKYKK